MDVVSWCLLNGFWALEKQGHRVYLLADNQPDLLIIRKNGTEFIREVKLTETRDGPSLKQWNMIIDLIKEGKDAWICDETGTDWPRIPRK